VCDPCVRTRVVIQPSERSGTKSRALHRLCASNMGLEAIFADENPSTRKMVDAFAWMLNIFTSVAIVMVNKQLMGGAGYGFSFATTLCGLHFMCTAGIGLCTGGSRNKVAGDEKNQTGEKMRIPPNDVAMFVVVAATSHRPEHVLDVEHDRVLPGV